MRVWEWDICILMQKQLRAQNWDLKMPNILFYHNNKQLMPGRKVKIGTKGTKKGIYNKYSREQRMMLIDMVEKQHRTLAASAKELGICQTTARLIMSTWREENRVFEKKQDRTKRERREQKKRAQQKRKELQEQKPEEERGQERDINVDIELRVQENRGGDQNGLLREDDAHQFITEVSSMPPQQLIMNPIQLQMVPNMGIYYFPQMYSFPPFYSMP